MKRMTAGDLTLALNDLFENRQPLLDNDQANKTIPANQVKTSTPNGKKKQEPQDNKTLNPDDEQPPQSQGEKASTPSPENPAPPKDGDTTDLPN